MEHQDFKTVTFNSKSEKEKIQKTKEQNKVNSQRVTNLEEVKIESDKKLGQILAQSRLAKGFNTQTDFVKELNGKTNLNISSQMYNRWESNKEAPTNEQIAKMEKLLGVKLPRNKKVKIDN